jgi:hypothetical protein
VHAREQEGKEEMKAKKVREECPECGGKDLTWPTVIMMAFLCGTGLGALYMILAFFAGFRS